MEVRATELDGHVQRLSAILREVCDAAQGTQLLQLQNLIVTTINSPFSRYVVTDLGGTEYGLPLPIPNSIEARFWIGVHERWEGVSKHRVGFRDCGVRVYFAETGEEAAQVLRLEWVAPTCDPDGILIYDGKHAGHPHWHVDRSALVGPESYWAALDALTAPASGLASDIEEFTAASDTCSVPDRVVQDCSWLHRIHLPAQAQWAKTEWNGRAIPAPHQSAPENIEALDRWWTGALRYLAVELVK